MQRTAAGNVSHTSQRIGALLRILANALMLCLLSSCTPADPLNVIARSGPWRVASGLAYAEGPRHTLDVYTPEGVTDAPVVVFFYGGNWESGNRSTYRFVAAALAARGIVTVVPDYRVYPQVKFPEFLNDGALAVAWVKGNIERYNGSADKIFLMGHSAGAHIAAMLTLDGQWFAKAGLDPRRDIAGLIGISGPYDFLPLHDDTLKIIFSGGDIKNTQPITFVGRNEPPALLVSGRNDHTVDPGNTRRLAAGLRRQGNRVSDKIYPFIGHMSIIAAFSPALRFLAPVLRDVEDFIANNAPQSKFARQAGRPGA
jgi:acetyl esterase/lipase